MKDLLEQYKDILKDYNVEIEKACEDTADEASQYTLNLVKQRSPRDANRKPSRVGKARYASGWQVEKENMDNVIGRFVIHNVNDPTLTHLLEYGHVMNFDHSKRARAIPHIKNSEQDGAEYYENILASKLEAID